MANDARKIMKAGNRKRTPGRRNGPVSTVNRSQNRISGAKQRRSDAAANPRKSFERYTALADQRSWPNAAGSAAARPVRQ